MKFLKITVYGVVGVQTPSRHIFRLPTALNHSYTFAYTSFIFLGKMSVRDNRKVNLKNAKWEWKMDNG